MGIKTVPEFELGRFMENGYPCDWQNSPFVSEHHSHVITDNISIVSNEALRGLISKGPNFREQNKIAWGKEKSLYWKQLKITLNHGQKKKKGKSQY